MKDAFSIPVSKNLRNSIRNSGGVCHWCGYRVKPCGGTIDHLIPKAVFKWATDCENPEVQAQLVQRCNDMRNISVAHVRCNEDKGMQVMPCGMLTRGMSEKERKDFVAYYKENKQLISDFIALVETVAEGQDNKCIKCQRKIYWFGDMVLRRKDSRLPRTADNACVMCFECSIRSIQYGLRNKKKR